MQNPLLIKRKLLAPLQRISFKNVMERVKKKKLKEQEQNINLTKTPTFKPLDPIIGRKHKKSFDFVKKIE